VETAIKDIPYNDYQLDAIKQQLSSWKWREIGISCDFYCPPPPNSLSFNLLVSPVGFFVSILAIYIKISGMRMGKNI
jgi:hypothetical protein